METESVPSRRLAVKAGWVFSGLPGASPQQDVVILIDDGSITDIVDSTGYQIPDGYELVDASTRYVTPGLINAHEHLEMHRQRGTMHTRYQRSAAAILMTAVENLLVNLAMGVTTVRDLGAMGTNATELREGVDSGSIVGPRVQACVQMIAMTGGHGQPLCYEADGIDEMVRAVRTQVKRGADVIKLCASGGVVAAMREDPWNQELSTEEMTAAVITAHRAGVRVAAHAQPPQAVKASIEAGVDSIEHGAFLDDECAELLASRGVTLVPTIDDSFSVVEFGDVLGRPQWIRESAKASLEYRMKGVSRAVEVGARLGVGTDVAGEMGREMARLVDCGLGALDAITAATYNGAELMGLKDSVGSIEVGKVADLIAVDSDPLDDLRIFDREVSLVIKGGVAYEPGALLSVCGSSVTASNAALVAQR